MMVEAEVDFDLAIEKFFDFFEDGSETGNCELKRESKPTKPRSKKEKEFKHEDATLLIAPKVLKNDIRRYYSQMFMNTINSGNFNQLQNYFSTFMRGPAKFLADYGKFNPSLRLPSQLVASGPKLMSHFLLGVFVMYPDMVMHMNDTRIITSSAWAGTKIEMSVDFFATKMYDLSMDEWIPQLQTLEEKCSALTLENKTKRKHKCPLPVGDVLSVDDDWRETDGLKKSFPSNSIVKAERNVDESCDLPESDRHESYHSGVVPDVCIPKNKRKRATGVKPDLSPTCKFVSTERITSHSAPATVAPLYTPNSTNIPEEYVHALCAQAALLPTPMELRMTGTVTLFLDENNHIQHMHMKVYPK